VDVFSAVGFMTAEYALISYDAGGITIVATAFIWLLLVALGFQALSQQPVDLRSLSPDRRSADVG
jgi:hypothetical protein